MGGWTGVCSISASACPPTTATIVSIWNAQESAGVGAKSEESGSGVGQSRTESEESGSGVKQSRSGRADSRRFEMKSVGIAPPRLQNWPFCVQISSEKEWKGGGRWNVLPAR